MTTRADKAHALPPAPGGQDEGAVQPAPDSARVLIVGLGNPVLGDDGIGWRVAEEVRRALAGTGLPATVESLALGGLRLMEHLVGWQAAILIDALSTGRNPPGTVTAFPLEALVDPQAGHLGSVHDASLPTALQLGQALGALLPQQIWIVAVEAQMMYEFTEALSPPVEAAIAPATQKVLAILHDLLADERLNAER